MLDAQAGAHAEQPRDWKKQAKPAKGILKRPSTFHAYEPMRSGSLGPDRHGRSMNLRLAARRALHYLSQLIAPLRSTRIALAAFAGMSILYSWNVWSFAQAWQADLALDKDRFADSDRLQGTQDGLAMLPSILQFYCAVSLACSALGLVGVLANKARFFRPFAVQQALDTFMSIFAPLAAVLLLLHPGIRAGVCAALTPDTGSASGSVPGNEVGSSRIPRTFAKPFEDAGNSVAAGILNSVHGSIAALSRRAGTSSAPTAGVSQASTCEETLLTTVIPLAVLFLSIYSGFRVVMLAKVYAFHRTLEMNEYVGLTDGQISREIRRYKYKPQEIASFHAFGSKSAGRVEQCAILRAATPTMSEQDGAPLPYAVDRDLELGHVQVSAQNMSGGSTWATRLESIAEEVEEPKSRSVHFA